MTPNSWTTLSECSASAETTGFGFTWILTRIRSVFSYISKITCTKKISQWGEASIPLTPLVSFLSQPLIFLFSSGLVFPEDQEHPTGHSQHVASTHAISPQPKLPSFTVNTHSPITLTPPPSPPWSGAPTTADSSPRPCLHYSSPDATLHQIASSTGSTSKIIYRITTLKHVDNLPTG